MAAPTRPASGPTVGQKATHFLLLMLPLIVIRAAWSIGTLPIKVLWNDRRGVGQREPRYLPAALWLGVTLWWVAVALSVPTVFGPLVMVPLATWATARRIYTARTYEGAALGDAGGLLRLTRQHVASRGWVAITVSMAVPVFGGTAWFIIASAHQNTASLFGGVAAATLVGSLISAFWMRKFVVPAAESQRQGMTDTLRNRSALSAVLGVKADEIEVGLLFDEMHVGVPARAFAKTAAEIDASLADLLPGWEFSDRDPDDGIITLRRVSETTLASRETASASGGLVVGEAYENEDAAGQPTAGAVSDAIETLSLDDLGGGAW